MQLKPFKELVALSKEKIDEAMAPIRAKQVRGKAELEMAHLEADILNQQTKVHELCLEKDIDFKAVLNLLDRIALLERRKEQYGQVVKQLFPEAA